MPIAASCGVPSACFCSWLRISLQTTPPSALLSCRSRGRFQPSLHVLGRRASLPNTDGGARPALRTKRAVAELCARGRNVELLVAGDGFPGYAKYLVNLSRTLGIDSRVKFPGHLTDPYPAMRASEIVAICSRREAFGRVGVEAMLFGTRHLSEYGRGGGVYGRGDERALLCTRRCFWPGGSIGDPDRQSTPTQRNRGVQPTTCFAALQQR